MNIAVLAVQGAFAEHEYMLEKLGANCVELRKREDIKDNIDGIVLPGGESTVQSKLMRDLDMFNPIQEMIKADVPVLATCAGMILLADRLSGSVEAHFRTLPITVKRNAYGRQLGSFSDSGMVKGISDNNIPFPFEFIRAPYIESIDSDEIEIIASINKCPPDMCGTKRIDWKEDGSNNNVVGVKYKNQLAFTCHPELTDDLRIHEIFLNLCKTKQ